MRIKYPSPQYQRRQAIKQAISTIAVVIVIVCAFGVVGRMDYDNALDNEARAMGATLWMTASSADQIQAAEAP